jgi:alkanesulfonate monooxygenase SsuD/methylene tetrahydromethanopterin reductase-like flavin-dependent oxidoreductase (luciferase family)
MARPPRLVIRAPRDSIDGGAPALRKWVEHVEATTIDGVFTGDHVSFHNGRGFDGLIEAATLVAASSRLTVWTAVYLLALRHPVPTARAVTSLATLAGGRFVFGVGLGGEDPRELEICGVDPRTRGRRLDAHVDAVNALLSGDETSANNAFVAFENAVIRPVVTPRVPVLIGGRSDAALRRVARAGDGWIAVWMSVDRTRQALETIAAHADTFDRPVPTRNALMVWCGLGGSAEHARSLVAPAMQDLYKIPFDRFARFTPRGTPDDVAEAIAPYLDLGFEDILINGVAEDQDTLIGLSDELARRLSG